MAQETKILVSEVLTTFSPYDFEGDMADIALKFDFKRYWKEVHIKNYLFNSTDIDIYVKFTITHGYEYDYGESSGHSVFTVNGFRYETDEEFTKRIEASKKRREAAKKAAENRKASQQKRELSLLKTLLQKHGFTK